MIGAIVSCYNQHTTVGDTIESLIAQRAALDCGLDVQMIDDASVPPISVDHSFPLPDDVCIVQCGSDENGGVQRIRNRGFKIYRDYYNRDDQPEFVIFVDGDVTFNPGAFAVMKKALDESDETVAYAYGHYSRRGALTGCFRACPFNDVRLRQHNFISTMSLIRFNVLVEATPLPFIENELRLQDWSLWLRLLNAGYTGVMVNEVLFSAYYPSSGVSVRDPLDYQKWREIIAKKYNT